jgi:polysaccharide pyruvyl transferase WcaK-like protein
LRIVVDPSTLSCSNMGDVAMLQVAVQRLNALWPSAEIHVFTEAPSALAIHCPKVCALSHQGRRLWFHDEALLGRLEYHAPRGVRTVKSQLGKWLRRRWPAALDGLQRWSARLRHRGDERRRNFLEQMRQVDLHVVSGAALLNDKNISHGLIVLQTMELAARRGVPVVMVSQGVGPLRDHELIDRARPVLPLVNLIALREGLVGGALLKSLGVSAERLMVTGDDAVEMARAVPSPVSKSGIGVNLRVAKSTEVPSDVIPTIRSVLQKAARQLAAPLVPIPIAFHSSADDPKWIRELLAGFDDDSDGGRNLATPREVIQQAGRCRIVVTAAYHAGVFALAQGVPIIAVVYNEYYELKFRGLREMFSGGCEVIRLQSPTWPEDLSAAIERTWSAAEVLRSKLEEAADRQVALGAAAYRRIQQLVEEWDGAAKAGAP